MFVLLIGCSSYTSLYLGTMMHYSLLDPPLTALYFCFILLLYTLVNPHFMGLVQPNTVIFFPLVLLQMLQGDIACDLV